MIFTREKGADAFGIRHGGLMGNPAGGRMDKPPGAIILSIGGNISGYLYLSCVPCQCIKNGSIFCDGSAL